MKEVSKKNIKTSSIEAVMSRKNAIKSTVDIKTVGVGCWEGDAPIDLSLNSSGKIVVHSCKDIFMRADELGEIEHITSEDGTTEYILIHFKSNN